MGRFPFDQKFRNFRNGDKWYGNFQGKVAENPENCWISEKRTIQPKILEIPGWKSNGTEISRKICWKIWVHLTRLSSFSEFMQIRNFLFSASSFGRDDSELDISRKGDGDAYSKIEILNSLSTYMSINTSYS